MDAPQFNCSPNGGYLGCFQFLTMNKDAMNICGSLYQHIKKFSFLQDKCPIIYLLGIVAVCLFIRNY